MEIDVAGPMYTQKNINGSMGQQCPYSTRSEKNIVEIILIYGARAILYYFVTTKTLNLSYEKCKLVYLDQYPPRKSQIPYVTMISILRRMGAKYCGLHIYDARYIS